MQRFTLFTGRPYYQTILANRSLLVPLPEDGDPAPNFFVFDARFFIWFVIGFPYSMSVVCSALFDKNEILNENTSRKPTIGPL